MNQEASVPPFWPLWKRIAKASPIYPLFLAVQRCRPAAQKRRVIAEMARQGTLVQAPPPAEETLRILADWEQAGRRRPASLCPQAEHPARLWATVWPFYAGRDRHLPRRHGGSLQRSVSGGLFHRIERGPRAPSERAVPGGPHVTIFQGDSATVLPKLLATIQEPCLFWLDGHYSGGITALGKSITPILDELQTISPTPPKVMSFSLMMRVISGMRRTIHIGGSARVRRLPPAGSVVRGER